MKVCAPFDVESSEVLAKKVGCLQGQSHVLKISTLKRLTCRPRSVNSPSKL
jgi:hypothetical protein